MAIAIPDIPIDAGAERREIDGAGYLLVAFFALPFFVFNILPVLFGVYVAFTRWSIVGAPKWEGTKNFIKAFHDQWVRVAFENIFFYGLPILPCVTVLGLLFALFVNRGYPRSSLARPLFFAPTVVSATVIGLVWVCCSIRSSGWSTTISAISASRQCR